MTAELTERLFDCDRRLKAARTPAEKRAAISHRKLVRAEADFVRACDAYDRANEPPVIRDSFRVIA